MSTKNKIEREHALISRRKLIGAILGGGGLLALKVGLDKLTIEDAGLGGGGGGPSAFFQLNDVTKLQPNDGDVWAYQASNRQWLNQAPTGLTSFQHALLSAQHSDTTPATPVQGDIITAQGSSPTTWARLPKPGAGLQVLQGLGFFHLPGWGGISFGQISGALLQSQFAHGHDSNTTPQPLATPPADQAFNTAVLANWTGMTISMKSRNGSQGLFGYVYVNAIVQMSAATIQGELTMLEDGLNVYTIPLSGSTLWHTGFFFFPIGSGSGFLDNNTHVYQIQARITNPPGTMTLGGTTYTSFISGNDSGTAVNIA